MSFYLLDTNFCIFLLNQRQGFERIVQRMDGLGRNQVGLSAITVAELEFGIAASKRHRDNFQRLERFLVEFEVLPFDRDAAKPYGALRKVLKTQGTPIVPLDFLIAAHALALNATLVTNNTGEFLRVPGLAVED
jgi:tRNA(fMet)-specific endonuclease VapC